MTGWMAALAIVGQSAAQSPMTLDQAIAIATSNAFSVRTSQSQAEKSRQVLNEAWGNLGPRLTGTATYSRFDRSPQTGELNDGSGQLTLSMPIDAFGLARRAIRGAEANHKANLSTIEASRRDIALAVRRAYYGVLQADAQATVALEARSNAQERVRNAEVQLELGAAARIDVLRLQTAMRQAESDVIATDNAKALARQSFNNVLARPIDAPVELAPVLDQPAVDTAEGPLTELAFSNRPELQALRLRMQFLENVRRATEVGQTPSLGLSVVHSRDFGALPQGARRESTTGNLALTVPLWDSGITRAKVKQARQDEEQTRIQFEQTLLGVSLEVRQALTNLKNAQARLTVADQQAEVAAETYRLAKIKFDSGEGIPLEVTDAQTELTRARTNQVTARFDVLRAHAELQRAVGLDRFDQQTTGNTQ